MSTKNSKRILKVVVKRMFDESPDTSWMGEYSNQPKTEYAIDRAHSKDCPYVDRERTDYAYQHELDEEGDTCTLCGLIAKETLSQPCSEYVWEDDCNCRQAGRWSGREYRYFNGCVENYKGEDPADLRKYIRQDYDRMESLNAGNWCFIGIRAEAEVQVPSSEHTLIQKITSGGLWGIESDNSYFEEVEKEQLVELKEQLLAIGFSRRAIAQAFKNVKQEVF